MKKKKLLVLFASSSKTSTLSYVNGYPDALKKTDLFEVTLCNFGKIQPFKWVDKLKIYLAKNYDFILMMHTTSHQLYYFWEKIIKKKKIPIIWFIGNEYRGMPEKLKFAKEMGISMLVSQSLSKSIHLMYQKYLNIKVIGLPTVGFENDFFFPGKPSKYRNIDIGYRGASSPLWFGHWEREDISRVFLDKASDVLKLDISIDMQKRLKRKNWAKFLRDCKTQLSTSSGCDYFELTDKTRYKVENYIAKNKNYKRTDIEKLLPPKKGRIKCRILSARILEAASSKTAQIIYNHDFEGPLKPDVDFIPLCKKHSNVDTIIKKIKDHKYLDYIANNCERTLKKFASYPILLTQLKQHLEDIS